MSEPTVGRIVDITRAEKVSPELATERMLNQRTVHFQMANGGVCCGAVDAVLTIVVSSKVADVTCFECNRLIAAGVSHSIELDRLAKGTA